ncbi:hypothetical protein [Tepidibacillus fermentans]|uniref:Uncharacterized protein n=1 Tax=Tepidibacillus fermentans TaxID=1281767 RepID=A0A4R3KHW7_9BACI|nr:hypothetical protein [Tepidibacillus fermentans]TCS83093.1 hypothetical protein EDD72_10619 [Tepidibacillus fermentans]
MKHKLFSTTVILLLSVVMALPVLANTSYWSLTLDYRIVDGDKNSVYHDLTSGTMTISGNIYPYSLDGGHNPSPAPVTFSVYKSVFGFDPFAGSTTVTPYSTLNSSKYFNANLGSETAGKYYLQVYKVEDDGWNEKGSGTLVTK